MYSLFLKRTFPFAHKGSERAYTFTSLCVNNLHSIMSGFFRCAVRDETDSIQRQAISID